MTASELSAYLTRLIDQNVLLSTMIWGPPGVGKSSIVQHLAASHELAFIDLRLSQLAPTDLRGLPVPRDDRSAWLPPEFLPDDSGSGGILFLDEINMAPPAMQGVAQQLILDRRVGSYRLPDGWFVWAAGNRKEDRAAVFDMPAPLANRFLHLSVEPDADDFRHYAFKNSLPDAVIGFLAFRQDLLHKPQDGEYAWPSPRSWEMASQLHNAGLPIAPAIGDGPASEFTAYLDITENVPDLRAILKGKKTPRFPAEPSLRYASVIGLVSRCESSAQAVNGFSWLVKQAPPEWVQLYASDLFPLLSERGQLQAVQEKIMKTPELKDFLTGFARLLAA